MNTFTTIVSISSGIMTIIGLLTLFVTPIREKVFKTKQKEAAEKERNKKTEEGLKCLLRSQMLLTYYHNIKEKEIRQYEKENFLMLYQSYKAMGGNSFIDDVEDVVRKWKVTT